MGADRLIYIRTDGNSKIAAGHLVRCLSIAQNCLKIGIPVCFLLSDEESLQLLNGFLTDDLKQNPGLSVQILKTAKYDDLERELPEVLALLSAPYTSTPSHLFSDAPSTPFSSITCSADASPAVSSGRKDKNICSKGYVYLLDSYFVTKKYLTTINSAAKVAYLDDLQLFDYPVDLIINYDVIPDTVMPSYRTAYSKVGKALLGAAYTPLRSQFENKAVTVKEKVTDILITTGGSDPYHFCVEFVQEFSEQFSCPSTSAASTALRNITTASDEHVTEIPTLHIVIGSLSKDKENLHALAKEYPFIKLHEKVMDMAALMSVCDLAISAAGTTLYELCALGVPTVSFTMADNQLVAAKAFDEAGAIPCAGDIRKEKDPMMDRIFDFLIQMRDEIPDKTGSLSSGYKHRFCAHETMHRLVDGNGAMRIAKELAIL